MLANVEQKTFENKKCIFFTLSLSTNLKKKIIISKEKKKGEIFFLKFNIKFAYPS